MVPLALAPVLAIALGVAQPASAAAPGAGARGEEIDRVLALVRSSASAEPRVITLTRVAGETRIALVGRGAMRAATEPLDAAALTAGLEWLVDQLLLIDDATRLQLFDADGGEGEEEVAAFRARFPRPADYTAFLRRWDITDDDVVAALRRSARVQRYLDSRVSHAAQVSEAEVTAWLEGHAADVGGRDRELARRRLADERVAAEVRNVLRDLRARAEIRVLKRTD
jgi:hypothetical protein